MISDNYFNREISWLSFNYRVLQEAKDPIVPLYERIKFLAIFSSNLDEFFRVRVASLKNLLHLKKKSQSDLEFDPVELLKQIHKTVAKHQNEFGEIYRGQIIPELQSNNIFLSDDKNINDDQKAYLKEYFKDNVREHIQPILMVKGMFIPFLQNRRLYLTVKLGSENKKNKDVQYALVEIPSHLLPRFVQLPSGDDKHYIMFLDDVIRYCLPEIFPSTVILDAYSVKLTRDAELYIDDEFSGDLLEKIKKGLSKRSTGAPSRFLYDLNMPEEMLGFLQEALNIESEDLVPGGRYHNFNDFFSFPNPGKKDLTDEPMPALRHREFDGYKDKFEAIAQKDFSFHFPYMTYNHVIELLELAAEDENVKSIKITQYRVAKKSAVISALIKAAQKGKNVMVFVEVKARFDEEMNIQWANEMEKAGIKVFYSFPGIKVHAKIALINREEDGEMKKYAFLSTGNFNEKTARIYSDIGIFTSDENITAELEQVFEFLGGRKIDYEFKHLLVAQFNMRKALNKMIEKEIKHAEKGKDGRMILKMNSLEDKKIIKKLYDASKAGVKIDIILRGICCLVPGVKKISENISVISILDRFLEHARIFVFNNKGKERIYCASADWMKRNLSRRVEVAFPIYDEHIREEIKHIIELQLSDNVKGRVINNKQNNHYQKRKDGEEPIRSQVAIYEYLKEKHGELRG